MPGTWTPTEMVKSLGAVSVDFSVSESDLEDWLGNPEFTPYPAIAEALLALLGDRRLARPVYIDVIVSNYEDHAASPRTVGDVVVDILKSAIVEGSNDRYGSEATTFESLLAPPSPIQVKWEQLGGAAGFLGAPVGPERPTADGVGRTRDFAGGTIAWHPALGAHAVGGAIGARWRELGREQWGYPITDESVTPDGAGRYNHFRTMTLPGTPECSIYWHPATGAHEVIGAIRQKWAELGWEAGVVGYPVGPEHARRGGGRIQDFQKNSIGWTALSGAFLGRITLSQVITTPSATELGGEAAFELAHDGSYRFRGHMHDSGPFDYDFRVRATIGSREGLVLTAQKSGQVEGLESLDPNRTLPWDESGTNALLQAEFPFLRLDTFAVMKEYSTGGVIGAIGSVLSDVVSFLVTDVVAGPQIAVAMLIGNELRAATGSPVVGLGGLTGTLAAAGGSFLVGPTFAIPIYIGATFATDLLFKHQTITEEEYAFADLVFRGQLPPRKMITLTNLAGAGGRAFTAPNLDGGVLVNLGDEAFSHQPGGPMRYTTSVRDGYPIPGQLLIHELTHAWQLAQNGFVPGYVCRGAQKSDYKPLPPGSPWGDFDLEEQAATVDQWFGQHAKNHVSLVPWSTVTDLKDDLEDQAALKDPYFPYIDGKVRLGQTS
jgi:hypothetical protein